MSQRKQFEAWAEANHYDLHKYCDVYSNAHTQAAWACWQASWVRARERAARRCEQVYERNAAMWSIDELTEYQKGFEVAADLCANTIRTEES